MIPRPTPPSDTSHRGVMAWTFLAITAASLEPVLVKVGYGMEATALQLLAVKTLTAAVLVVPLTKRLRWVDRAAFRHLGFAAVLLLATSLLTLLALRLTTAVAVITAVTTTPALVALANRRRGREVIPPIFWVGFAACFAGVSLTVRGDGSELLRAGWPGLLCVAGAVLTSTVYRLQVEDLTREHDPLVVSTWIFLIDAALVLVCVWPWIPSPSPATLRLGAVIGAAAVAANVAFVAAIALLGATRMSIFNLLSRPLVVAVACLVLHEPLASVQVAGMVLVLAGVRLARVEPPPGGRTAARGIEARDSPSGGGRPGGLASHGRPHAPSPGPLRAAEGDLPRVPGAAWTQANEPA